MIQHPMSLIANTSARKPGLRIGLKLAACWLALCQAGLTAANPLGATVVSGQASFAQQDNQLTITNSPNAIINWSSFSINAGEVTRFVQQNSASSVLNRITGQDPSQILGALQSNGRVYLINPNGILFGADAQVNVGGLFASTLAITNDDFLAGRHRFQAGPIAGDVRNLGAITTPSGGQVVLIAPKISNEGIITSPQGDIILAAGQSVQLADTSNLDMQVVISASNDQAVNLGQIVAQGGRIGIYGALIQQRGRVSADSAVLGDNGRILLKSSRTALLEAGSVTSATSAGTGGQVAVLGPQVALTGNARIDTSGDTGGGTVLVGGSYRRSDPSVMTAAQSFVDCDASIAANARVAGNGGTVVVWGERSAQVYGSLSARGGAQAGNGGMIETSGRWLDTFGLRVDASAPRGSVGSWLLDPEDIIVSARGVALPSNGVLFATPGVVGLPTYILASSVSASTANVLLEATHDLSFTTAVNITTAGVGLTGRAGNDINVNASINTNGGDIVLSANHGSIASGSGQVRNASNLTIDAGGGMVTLSGASDAATIATCLSSPGTAGCATTLPQADAVSTPALRIGATIMTMNSTTSNSQPATVAPPTAASSTTSTSTTSTSTSNDSTSEKKPPATTTLTATNSKATNNAPSAPKMFCN